MGHEDVLRTIREAEDAAAAAISKAESEATSIVQKARLEAAESLQTGRTDSEAEAQKIVADARKAAEKEAGIVSADGDATIDSIHNSGKKNRDKAVNTILDAFRA